MARNYLLQRPFLWGLGLSVSVVLCLSQFFACLEPFHPLAHLAGKTPYPAPSAKTEHVAGLEQCRVIHINHLARHGSRHATKSSDLDSLTALVTEAANNHQLSVPQGQQLLKWLLKAKEVENAQSFGQLSGQGKAEHRHIAERMYQTFNSLFSQSDARKPIVLQSTKVQRTKDSLTAFLDRLVEFQPALARRAEIHAGDKKQCDPTLRFFDGCTAYRKYLNEHPKKSAIEQAVWSPQAKENINNVLRRIFKPDFIKKLDDKSQVASARHLYHLCQLDADLDRHRTGGGFCSLFTKVDEIEPFNWEEDASSYFSKGYAGSPGSIAHRVACPLLADFINTTDEAITNPTTAPIANLRFAHAETIIPFLVHMGLYREDSVDGMIHQPQQRKFRTAQVAPMAANVQWILYQCPGDHYRVRLSHNEVNISFPIPGCENASWCDWQSIKRYYEQEGRLCDESTWENDICQGTSCIMGES